MLCGRLVLPERVSRMAQAQQPCHQPRDLNRTFGSVATGPPSMAVKRRIPIMAVGPTRVRPVPAARSGGHHPQPAARPRSGSYPARQPTADRRRQAPILRRSRVPRHGRSGAAGGRGAISHWEASHGFKSGTPVGAKSATFLVTTVMPCARAVAAMNASRSGRGSGT